MPIKRGNGGRRGFSKGPEKSVIKRPLSGSALVRLHHKKRSAATKFLTRLAEFTFNSIVHKANTFYVIPMKYESEVCSLTSASLSKLLHYCVLFFFFARMANIIYICTWLIFEDFNIATSLCFTILTMFLLSLSVGCGNILISRESVQLMNTWRQVLGIIGEVRGRPVGMFENAMLSMKIIAIGGIALIAPLVMASLPVVYSELPVSLQYQMKQFLPDVSDLWTHVIGFPVEMTIWFVAALIAASGACNIMISVELVIFFGHFMRALRLNTAAHYQQMTRLVRFYKVYNAVLNVWYKVVTPPAFFMASASIVVFLYISVRHTELPIYIYCFYPYVATAVFFIEFGICYDGLAGCAAMEEVVSNLRSRHMECFRRMSVKDREIAWRYGKATRPLVLNVGLFTTFNIGVPLSLWDEIVNQLVLLLTL